MKSIKSFIAITLALLAFAAQKAYASHAAGAELLYEHVSGNTYKITYKFYRDCTGISEPSSLNCCYFNSCSPSAINSIILNKISGPNGTEVALSCPGFGTTCGSGSTPGYREWIYTGIVTLATQCNYWTFYVGENARNSTITNLVNPGSQTLYVETTFDNLAANGNSSPYFTVKPVPYTCVGSPYIFNNGAVDPDGDSLSFDIVAPLDGPTTCQAYPNPTAIAFVNSSYNLIDNPIDCGNSFSIDPQTGAISFTPISQQRGVVTVRVKEWRNGQVIGTILRDLQIVVLPCNNISPTLNIPANTLNNATLANGQITMCANETGAFCYDIVAPNPAATLQVSDNHLITIPTSTINYSGMGTDSVRGCFSWTPTAANAGLNTVNITSSGCLPGSAVNVATTFTIIINVLPNCNVPPVLTVSDSSDYCSATCKPIAPNLTVQGAAANLVNGAKVYFTSGYVQGEDILSIPTQGGISGSFDAATGVLTVNGVVSPAQFEAALRTVCYQNIAPNATLGLREIYFAMGTAIYNPDNGHFYKLIDYAPSNITWTDAKLAAASSHLFGMQGYLLTITSQQENDFCSQLIKSNSWMGCTDSAQEGSWRWITGCEGLENGGQGRLFFTSASASPCNSGAGSANAGYYTNWLAGQPDDCSGGQPIAEDYGHFMMATDKWVDYKNNENVSRFIIEYGCMPGDPLLQVTGMAKINVTTRPNMVLVPATAGICAGDSITLTASGNGIFSWSPATGLSATTGNSVIASPSTTTSYTATLTDANGCSNSITRQVTVTAKPTVIATSNSPVCEGQQIIFTASSSSGAGGYTWSGAAFSSSLQNPVINNATTANTGAYTVYNSVNGCSSDPVSVNVVVNPLPIVDAGRDTSVCKLMPIQLQATGTAANYTWAPGNTLSCVACTNPIASVSTTTAYVVTGTDNNGCSKKDTVVVNIYSQPNIDAGPDVNLCEGSTVTLTASGGVSYTWAPAANLSCTQCSSAIASPVVNTIYTVVGIDQHGCTDSDKVTVTVITETPKTYGKDDSLCVGEQTQLYAAGGDTYTWSPSAGLDNANIANPIANPAITTLYTVVITQSGCFTDSGKVLITVHPQPKVAAGPDYEITESTGAVIDATATDATKYVWTPAEGLSCNTCLQPLATPLKTTTYVITASNEYCTATDTVQVRVVCGGNTIFMPNTFTPNGDGLNDRLFPQRRGNGTITSFRIFSRWGEKLFEVQNIPPNNDDYGWDGTYKGRPMIADVYVYVINGFCESGEPVEVKGDITLVR